MDIDYNPPRADELEISLFGPGVGESIVLHIGDNNWGIIDSCFCPQSKEPAGLNYLRKMGLDVSNCVKLIVVTHWHNDHIRGICETVKSCHSAQIAFASPFLKQEFLVLSALYSNPNAITDRGDAGVEELAATIRALYDHGGHDRSVLSRVIHAHAGTVLYDRIHSGHAVHLRALSPSNVEISQSIAEFDKMLKASINGAKKTLCRPDKNENAIAIHVSFGNLHALLGSDLEVNGQHSGWDAVLSDLNKPRQKAKIYKVPHHGSANAHHNQVIANMLEDSPISVLTTFNSGRSALPQEGDIQRIKNHSESVYSTTIPRSAAIQREPAVARTLKDMGIRVLPIPKEIGHVQIRLDHLGNAHHGLNSRATTL